LSLLLKGAGDALGRAGVHMVVCRARQEI
jgi:hypothetical protein